MSKREERVQDAPATIVVIGENDERVINEDETAILNIIERGAGELPQIIELLQNVGSFSDDISFIRVEIKDFNPQPIAIATDLPVAKVQQQLSKVKDLIRQKDFSAAEIELQKISNEFNVETIPQYYVLLSRIQLHSNELELARQSIEKAIQLGHEVAATYKSLGNILYKLRKKQEAIEAWHKSLALNPNDEALRNLLDSIK